MTSIESSLTTESAYFHRRMSELIDLPEDKSPVFFSDRKTGLTWVAQQTLKLDAAEGNVIEAYNLASLDQQGIERSARFTLWRSGETPVNGYVIFEQSQLIRGREITISKYIADQKAIDETTGLFMDLDQALNSRSTSQVRTE